MFHAPVTHHAALAFWDRYHALPASIQPLADKAFALLKTDPRHPALHLKKVGAFWSARAGLHHRAIGVQVPEGGALVLDRDPRRIRCPGALTARFNT